MRSLLILLVCGVMLVACEVPPPPPPPSVLDRQVVEMPEESFDMKLVETVGNHSYAPINKMHTRPGKIPKEILSFLDAFEKEHPDWEVTSWSIEKDQQARGVSYFIYGLWINHRPRN